MHKAREASVIAKMPQMPQQHCQEVNSNTANVCFIYNVGQCKDKKMEQTDVLTLNTEDISELDG